MTLYPNDHPHQLRVCETSSNPSATRPLLFPTFHRPYLPHDIPAPGTITGKTRGSLCVTDRGEVAKKSKNISPVKQLPGTGRRGLAFVGSDYCCSRAKMAATKASVRGQQHYLESGRGVRPQITALDAQEATLALVRHTVAAKLFDEALLVAHLFRCAQVASTVGVKRLHYPRTLDSLPLLSEAILCDIGE